MGGALQFPLTRTSRVAEDGNSIIAGERVSMTFGNRRLLGNTLRITFAERPPGKRRSPSWGGQASVEEALRAKKQQYAIKQIITIH